MRPIYTIKCGNKTLGLTQVHKYYVIGFKSVMHARSVQFAIDPDPDITFVRRAKTVGGGVDVHAMLSIPKHVGPPLDPWKDVGFHLQTEIYDDFVMTPFAKGVGVIMPYDLVDETTDSFVFDAHLIEPDLKAKLFKRTLSL